VTAFVNVNGRDRVLNPGPLSRRPDESSTTPQSATFILVFISSEVCVVTALRPIVKVSLPALYLALCALMAAQFFLKTAFRRAVSSALAKCNLCVVYNPQNTF
jgi:hypothetical protein